jgi:hypothetical protein
MFLDDLIEGCQHRGNGVVRRTDVPLWIAARQLLHQVSHGVLPCIATRGQKKFNLRFAARQLLHQVSHGVLPCIATGGQKKFKSWIAARQLLHQVWHGVLPCIATRGQKIFLSCGLPLGNFCTRSCMAYFPTGYIPTRGQKKFNKAETIPKAN